MDNSQFLSMFEWSALTHWLWLKIQNSRRLKELTPSELITHVHFVFCTDRTQTGKRLELFARADFWIRIHLDYLCAQTSLEYYFATRRRELVFDNTEYYNAHNCRSKFISGHIISSFCSQWIQFSNGQDSVLHRPTIPDNYRWNRWLYPDILVPKSFWLEKA